jgi:hypothetical protein
MTWAPHRSSAVARSALWLPSGRKRRSWLHRPIYISDRQTLEAEAALIPGARFRVIPSLWGHMASAGNPENQSDTWSARGHCVALSCVIRGALWNLRAVNFCIWQWVLPGSQPHRASQELKRGRRSMKDAAFLNVFPSRRYQALAHPTREEEPVQDERNYWFSGRYWWTRRPCSWQGRLITATYIVLLVIVTLFSGLRIQGAQEPIVSWSFTALCLVVIVGAFYGVLRLKSGPPHQG